MSRPRLRLIHGPTPIVRRPALDALTGVELWIKRDDAIAGAEAGNKLRKLEMLLGEAVAQGKRAIVTCGGLQSNHARATAIVCAELGLRAELLLRVPDPEAARRSAPPATGNLLLDRLVGAGIQWVSPDEYRQRVGLLEQAARRLEDEGFPAYVVPEGGSNGLGALGYFEAMREVREQMDLGLTAQGPFDVVAHACGSGGTAAGVLLGAEAFGVAREVRAFAVCDDAPTFERIIGQIVTEARAHLEGEAPGGDLVRLVVDDTAKGPAYAVQSDDQRAFLVEVARRSGLILDPVYTGKALYGVAQAVSRGAIPRGARVLFIHTGGLPGLLAQADELAPALGRVR
jgi:D-cysteine desulfhydrase